MNREKRSVLCVWMSAVLHVLSFASFAAGKSNVETNALIRAMLRSSLIRVNFDEASQSFVSGPRMVSSQEVFFAPEEVWTSDEKRAVFDWYLQNLPITARRCGVIAGYPWIENPMACAAVEQCEAMFYTNALPFLIESIRKDFDQSRARAIRLIVSWSPFDQRLNEIIRSVVTNQMRYTRIERNEAYRDYCAKLVAVTVSTNESLSADVESGVDLMYERREDPDGAVSIDQMLIHIRPSYSNGVERYECALSLLANTNSFSGCLSYFTNVTNTLDGGVR